MSFQRKQLEFICKLYESYWLKIYLDWAYNEKEKILVHDKCMNMKVTCQMTQSKHKVKNYRILGICVFRLVNIMEIKSLMVPGILKYKKGEVIVEW